MTVSKEEEMLVRKFIISVVQEGQTRLSKSDELPFHIIKYFKCLKSQAEDFIEKMKLLGLEACADQYNVRLADFAIMRGYMSVEEIERIENIFKYKPKPRGIKRR